eukprot:460478_1
MTSVLNTSTTTPDVDCILWDVVTEQIEAAREDYDTGDITINELTTIYETNLLSLSQCATKFTSSNTNKIKQQKLDFYSASLQTLYTKIDKLNKPASSYTYKNMDNNSIWLQNKQFLSEITNDKLFQIQPQIITELFGSFKRLLQQIIKHSFSILTTSQQIQLNKILTNQILMTSTTNITQINTSLIELPDDCLSYIMQYLNNHSRGTVRRCCKPLAILVA